MVESTNKTAIKSNSGTPAKSILFGAESDGEDDTEHFYNKEFVNKCKYCLWESLTYW